MHYTLQTKSDIKVYVGDTIEVLEAYYRKYADDVMVSKFRHKGRVYDLTVPLQPNVDMVKLGAHEGYVEGVNRSSKLIELHVSLMASDTEYNGNFTDSYRTRH